MAKMNPVVNVHDLPLAVNACGQQLREVYRDKVFSMAHVTMAQNAVSLAHHHLKMSEIYYILEGTGVLQKGDASYRVSPGSYVFIPPKAVHRLANKGDKLEHLVFAFPAFDPKEVIINERSAMPPLVTRLPSVRRNVTSLDGSTVYELTSSPEKKRSGISLAYGSLLPTKKAEPHFHKRTTEIYVVQSGKGRVQLNKREFDVTKGSIVHVPPYAIHGLTNTGDVPLDILCVASPPYRDSDFYTITSAPASL